MQSERVAFAAAGCKPADFELQGCRLKGVIRGHVEKNAVRRLLLVLGGLAVLAASFFATLLILDSMDTPRTPAEARNAMRAAHARQLKAALEKFRATYNTYPTSPDFNDIGNLQDLVVGGYLTELPSDPQSANGKKYLYASNGTVFGLLFELEAGPDGTPAAGTCVSRGKADTSSFKGFAPDCPF